MDYTNRNTIFDYLANDDIEDGTHTMTLANSVVIKFDIINYKDDKVFDKTVTIGDNVTDTKMLVLKFHKNCTINKGVTVTPQVRKKGFTIYCAGTLTNNGSISMTARGSSANGEDVLLYTNTDGTYEIVPAIGAAGGVKIGGTAGSFHGNKGAAGTARRSGGGGSGSRYSNYQNQWAGAGGAGTSYSGGAGGGGVACYIDGNQSYIAGDGSSSGGAGGNANCRRTTANNHNATGGAGNLAGYNARRTSNAGDATVTTERTSVSGTGGLLNIFSTTLINTGDIQSNGSDSGLSGYNNTTHCRPGGASGGGSINIFYNSIDNTGTITTTGGIGATGALVGGHGGDGCVTLTRAKIVTKKFITQKALYTILKPIAHLHKNKEALELITMENNTLCFNGKKIESYMSTLWTGNYQSSTEYLTLASSIEKYSSLKIIASANTSTEVEVYQSYLEIDISNIIFNKTNQFSIQFFKDVNTYYNILFNFVNENTLIISSITKSGIIDCSINKITGIYYNKVENYAESEHDEVETI